MASFCGCGRESHQVHSTIYDGPVCGGCSTPTEGCECAPVCEYCGENLVQVRQGEEVDLAGAPRLESELAHDRREELSAEWPDDPCCLTCAQGILTQRAQEWAEGPEADEYLRELAAESRADLAEDREHGL